MRIISSEELALVSGGDNESTQAKKATDGGGGFWGGLGGFFYSLFGGGSSSNSCTPSSTTAGGMTTTQTCGANGVSTVSITGPGYLLVQTSVPNPGGSGSASFGRVGVNAAYNGGTTVTTTSIVNGRVSSTR